MALFGGVSSSKSSSKGNKSNSRQAPSTNQQQPATKKAPAPPPQNLMMEEDLFGVGTTTIEPSIFTQNMQKTTTDSLMDLFSAPASASALTGFGSLSTIASPSFVASPPTPPAAQPVLSPNPMDTAHFGSLWGSHSIESRPSIRVSGLFSDFIQMFTTKIGCRLVEFIPATEEAIFAGNVNQETVLIHAKDKGSGAVDLMVRSRLPPITDKVVQACLKL